MVNSKNIDNDGSPGDESTRTSVKKEDIKVKVEITANELDEYKYHLNSLSVKERGDLLKQLHLFQEMEFNKDKNSSVKELDSENDIKDCGKNIAPPRQKRAQPRSWKKIQWHMYALQMHEALVVQSLQEG
jgi:hypothetical protein